MSVNLLLDTNILRQIISTTEFSPALRQLKFLIENKYVTLLVPEVLISEWSKHREKKKAEIQKELLADKKDVKRQKLVNIGLAEFNEAKIDEVTQLLYSQLEVVDKLLSDHGVKIDLTDDVRATLWNQQRVKKVPLKTPKNNTNDAELIFSTLSYLTKQEELELFFVSNNATEFSLPDSANPTIHPDISDVFPSIKINYYLDLKEAYKVFDELGIPRHKDDELKKVIKIREKITIDKKRSVLDQIHEYLEKRFRLLSFIPKKLFLQHYPFIIGDTFDYVQNPFTVVTDNFDVYNLLTKVRMEDGIVSSADPGLNLTKEDEAKIAKILIRLFHNNIFRIAFKNDESVPIKYKHVPRLCDCANCHYIRMDWKYLIELGQAENQAGINLEHQLNIAYGLYKVGNFYKAATYLQGLLLTHGEKKDIISYVIQFNLKHLAPLLRNHYWDNTEVQELALELSNIDLEKVLKGSDDFEHLEILNWLHNKEFISENLYLMHGNVNQITDHYYGQNTGHNNHTSNLIDAFASAESFLSKNSIIYDYYSNYTVLTNLLTQGLLASYGCNPLLNGKHRYFSEFDLEIFLFTGNPDDLQKFLTRYKLKDVHYKYDEINAHPITSVLQSVAENYPSIKVAYVSNQNLLSKYFWEQYHDVLFNALTILGMIDLDQPTLNSLTEKFLVLFENETDLDFYRILKYLRFLFNRKNKLFSDDLLQRFYLAAIKNKQFHAEMFFEVLVGIIQDRKIEIQLSDQDFEIAKTNFIIQPFKNRTIDLYFSIGYLFGSLSSDKHKQVIRDYVKSQIDSNFNSSKYYIAAMFDMIAPTSQLNSLYETEIEDWIKQGPRDNLFTPKDYYFDSKIDNYLNFCLKYSVEIPAAIRDQAKNLGAYYRWLFDIEGFDYSEFNPKWLFSHFTHFFKQKFRNSIKLKSHLLQLIRQNSNTELERMFILTYCNED